MTSNGQNLVELATGTKNAVSPEQQQVPTVESQPPPATGDETGTGTPVEGKPEDNEEDYKTAVVSIESEYVEDNVASESASSAPLLVEESPSKETFASKLEYLLTLVSYAIGFGTMWRFPYLMQQHGGVLFLIPYTFMLIFVGIPVFLLELAVGQRIRKSSLKAWNQVSPFLSGIGVACAFSCVLIGFYENTLISWCLAYLLHVYKDPLPWKDCSLATEEDCAKDTDNEPVPKCRECNLAGPSSYFWYNNILGVSDSITESGQTNWTMFGCLIVSWILIWLILVKGMKVMGKVAILTSTLPYFVMVIFLIRGLFLDGMIYGFEVVFTPQWNKLLDIKVWFIAGTQILFTQGVAVGILVSYAALQPANNNCIKDAITVPLIDFSTSILAALVNCPILGSKGLAAFKLCELEAKQKYNSSVKLYGANALPWSIRSTEEEIYNVTTSINSATDQNEENRTKICDVYESVKQSAGGTGLIFITFTQAVNEFPAPQVWAFLFFFMLLTVGLGSSFPQIEGFVLCLQDMQFHHLSKFKKWKITTVVCLILMCFSVLFAWGWGQYMLTFIDEFTANWSLLIISICECAGISWVYGLRKFSYDMHLMTGVSPSNWFMNVFMICVKFITPFVMLLLLIFSLVQYGVDDDSLSYLVWERDLGTVKSKIWPTHVLVLGFLLTLTVVGSLFIFSILAAFKIYPLKSEDPAHFPERRLRRERGIPPEEYDDNCINQTNTWKQIMYWRLSKFDLRTPPLSS